MRKIDKITDIALIFTVWNRIIGIFVHRTRLFQRFLAQIMLEFKNVFNFKIISLLVTLIFFTHTTAYGIDLYRRSSLRPQLQTSTKPGIKRLTTFIREVTPAPTTSGELGIMPQVELLRPSDDEVETLLGRKQIDFDLKEIRSNYEDKIILITGAGSLGSEICRQLATLNPRQVIIVDFNKERLERIVDEMGDILPMIIEHVDIADKSKVMEVFTKYKPEIIIHTAAEIDMVRVEAVPSRSIRAIKTNIIGTHNLLEAANTFGVQMFINISSDKAVDPINIYGRTKRLGELMTQVYARDNTAQFVTLRLPNLLQTPGKVFLVWENQIKRKEPVTVTDRKATRYFISISEGAQLALLVGTLGKGKGGILVPNIDGGLHSINIYDLARTLVRLRGYEPESDIPIHCLGLRPGEKLEEDLWTEEEARHITRIHEYLKMIPDSYELDNSSLDPKIETLTELTEDSDIEGIRTILQEIMPAYQSRDLTRQLSRTLTIPEITELIGKGCLADNWNEVRVGANFVTSNIGNSVRFKGRIYIEGGDGTYISNAMISNSNIASKVNIIEGSVVEHAKLGLGTKIRHSVIQGKIDALVIIEENVELINSYVYSNSKEDARATWNDYDPELTNGYIRGKATIIRSGTYIDSSYVNNSIVGNKAIVKGAYLEMAELLDRTWVYPNARVVLARIGGKVRMDMCSLSAGSLMYLDEYIGFHAAVAVDELLVGKEKIQYPAPIVNLGGVTPNFNGEYAPDLLRYEKGVPFLCPGVVLEKGSVVYAIPRAKPHTKIELVKEPIGTYLGPCVRIKAGARAIGAIPAFTLVNGMSMLQWDIGAILDDEPELIASTIYTMIEDMNKDEGLYEAWTESHNEIINQWILDGLSLVDRLITELENSSDPEKLKKIEMLEKGKERFKRHVGKWSLEFRDGDVKPYFIDPEKQILLDQAVELDAYATGSSWKSPIEVKSDEYKYFSPSEARDIRKMTEENLKMLDNNTVQQLRDKGININGSVFVDRDYDLENIKPGAELLGTVYLLKGVIVEGKISNSFLSAGHIYRDAVILESTIDNSDIKGEALFSSISSSVIKDKAVAMGSKVDGTQVGMEAQIAHCELKGAELWPYVVLHNVEAEKQVSDEAPRVFSLPNIDMMLAGVNGQMPKGALIAYKIAIEKTFERACSYGEQEIAVDKMVFGPGVEGYCCKNIVNSIIGLGTRMRGVHLMNNVIVHEDNNILHGADIEDSILERGSTVGARVRHSVIAGKALHSDIDIDNVFILLWAPGFIARGSSIPEGFQVVFESERGFYGVLPLERSENNIGGGTKVSRIISVDAFLAGKSEIERKNDFIVCGFDSFVTGNSKERFLLPFSRELVSSDKKPQQIFDEAVTPGRVIQRTITNLANNINYADIIKASISLTTEMLRFQHSKRMEPKIDAGIILGERLIDSGCFETIRRDGVLTFKYPFRRVGTKWISDALKSIADHDSMSASKEEKEQILPFESIIIDEGLRRQLPAVPENNVPRYIAFLVNSLFLSEGQDINKKSSLFIASGKGQSEIRKNQDGTKIFVQLDFNSEVPLKQQLISAMKNGFAVVDAEIEQKRYEEEVPLLTVEKRRHAKRELIKPVGFSGISLHHGESSVVTIKNRSDAKRHCIVKVGKDSKSLIEVSHKNTQIRQKSAGLVNNEGVGVIQVEHILSVLMGLSVKSVEIEIDGEEPPILDGSSEEITNAIFENSKPVEVEEETVVIKAPFIYMSGDSIKVIALPAEQRGELSVTAVFDKPGYVNNRALAHVRITTESFKQIVAPSRTVYPEWQLARYWREGLFRAAGPQTGVTIMFENSEDIGDEVARHKILDFLGDIACLGLPIEGHFIIMGTGHRDHIGLTKSLGGWIDTGEGIYSYNGVYSNITSVRLFDTALTELLSSGRLPDLIVNRIKGVLSNNLGLEDAKRCLDQI